jgi:RecB family exonuclease
VIDRLSCKDDGTYEIHDYKTGVLTPHIYLESGRQLPLYALAVKHQYHDARKILLIWHFLSADKEIVLTKTDEQLEKLRNDITGLIDEIESSKEFKPRKSELCDWCEFRSLCPEWGHIAKTESMPPNEYLNEPGVKLVPPRHNLERRGHKSP